MKHLLIIDPLLKGLGSNLVATGHSLGGGLAQIAVARHAAQFSEVYTYQSANIKKSDVDRLAKQNAALKARQYRIGGDQVPTSGEAAVTGEIVEVNRQASGAGLTQNANAAGGHNAPVAIEMLREMNSGGLIGKGNALAHSIIKNGSRDNADLLGGTASFRVNNTYPTALDTTPGREGIKQNVTGSMFIRQFVSTYQNNAVYNILAERALPVLQNLRKGLSPDLLAQRLQAIAREMVTKPIEHTESSRLMLKVIFDQLNQGAFAQYRSSVKEWQKNCEDLDFDSKIIDENKRRFIQDTINFWYSVHVEDESLYIEAKKFWPQDPA